MTKKKYFGGTLPHKFISEFDLRPRKLAPALAICMRDRVRPRSATGSVIDDVF